MKMVVRVELAIPLGDTNAIVARRIEWQAK